MTSRTPSAPQAHPEAAIRIGVSACLLGAEVRFDGQHKRNSFLVDELGAFVEFVPVCPEVELGMGTPREAVRLVGGDGATRMLGTRSGTDWTRKMVLFAAVRSRALTSEGLAGYVFKARSPSCGMERVRVYTSPDPGSQAQNTGVGLFAAALQTRFPNLPQEEEGRLCDARLRENFIERVFAYHRLQALWNGRWTVGGLVRFHTAHKMALLAHSTDGYRELGRLVAGAKHQPRVQVRDAYERGFMSVLKKMATPGRHANVLMHMAGHLKDRLDAADKRELGTVIDHYRSGLVPLVVPLTLLRHHVRRHAVAYLLEQIYLDPHPKELMLRNHV